MRKRFALFIVGLTVLAGIAVTGPFWAPAFGWLLTRSDPPDGAAPAVVLMGDPSLGRAAAALDLYTRGNAAALIVMHEEMPPDALDPTRRPGSLLHRDWLRARGVKEDALILLDRCENTSTVDEAACALRYLQTLDPRPTSAYVVTSWFHTARAGWVFDHVFAGSGITPRLVPALMHGRDWRTWWRYEDDFLVTFNEYLKWAYWLRRGAPQPPAPGT